MKKNLSLIAAIGLNRAIGKGNGLIWHIQDDLKRFKELTSGHPVIMGRKTWESLPEKFRPLPGRTNIVVTRNDSYKANDAIIKKSLEEAIASGGEAPGGEEIFVIGGGEIYGQAILLADRLYLTVVEDEPDADIFFPDYSNFKRRTFEEKRVDEKTGLRYAWINLEKT